MKGDKIMEKELNNNYLQRAMEYLDKGEHKNCISYVNLELKNINKYINDEPNPKYLELLILKIKCFQRLSMYHKVIQYCDIILSLEPNNIFALNEMAEAYIDSTDYSGQYECDILDLYRRALSIEPYNIDTLNRKADFLTRIGFREEACSYYDLVLTIDSNNITALYGKAELSSPIEALNYYDSLIELEPDNKEFLIGKLSILEKLRMFEDVIINCDKFLEIYQGEKSIIASKVRGLIYQGKFYDAVDCFYKETNINTRYIFMYNYIMFRIYSKSIKTYEELAITYDLRKLNDVRKYMKEMLNDLEVAENRIQDTYYDMLSSADEYTKIEINFDVTILVSYIERIIKRISDDIYLFQTDNCESNTKNIEKLYDALESIFNINSINLIKLNNLKKYELFCYKASVREFLHI